MDTKIKLINTLKKYKSKQENFDVLCQQTINSLESLGIDIDNISLKHNQEGNYDYMFNENQYRINQEKKIAVPLNRNKKNINFYDKFLKCTKLPIKSFVYVEDEKDKFGRSLTTKKEISQTYMIGYVNNRPYEFSFSIIKAAKNNEKLSDFSIVLSVLVSKQNNLWVELARFDSCGPAHINYFNEDGNVLEDVSPLRRQAA